MGTLRLGNSVVVPSVIKEVPVTPTVQSLSITPSTSQQTITATSSIDGYAPITVDAVTSSIDSNIAAGNIKSGVSILGVNGTVTELNGETQSVSLTSTLGDTFTPGTGKNAITSITVTPNNENRTVNPSTSSQSLTVNSGYSGNGTITVNPVTSAIDANITAGNIKDGVTILGVTGTCVELNGETKTITPTTSSQTVYPTSPKNAITEVTVNAVTSAIDNNIIAGNIKNGITILGVTGNYTGGGTGNAAGIIKTVDSNNVLQRNTTVSVGTATSIGLRGMRYGCYKNLDITTADFSGITTITTDGLAYCFQDCTGLTTLDLSDVTSLTGVRALSNVCNGCTSLVNLYLGSLAYAGDTYAGSASNSSMYYAFHGCTSLTSVTFTSLFGIYGNYCMAYCFGGCTSLTTLSFPALTSAGIDSYGSNKFTGMLDGCSNVTVHFPSNLQSVIGSWSDVTNGFGGTNTTVLFDLTATQ